MFRSLAVAATLFATAARAECPIYLDEVEYGAHRHNMQIVELPAAQRDILVDNWNHTDPRSDDHPARVLTVQMPAGTLLLMVDGDNCVMHRGVVDADTLGRLLTARTRS